MSSKAFTVTTSGDNWVVLAGGKTASHHRKKSAAIRKAKRLAKKYSGKGIVNIFGKDDKRQRSHKYGL